jgi:RNA polymerase sigma-70 factor (ECF subfamily)
MRGFEQRSSVRTWASRIARNASIQYRTRSRRKGREVLAGDSTLEALAEEITTTTASRLERARNELVALRLELPHDDQELLILRAERGLSFRDIAVVMSDPVPVSDEDITREAARLRKRFQMVKDRLHALAKERGIAWTS